MSHITLRIPQETLATVRSYAMDRRLKRGRKPDVSHAIRTLIAIALTQTNGRKPSRRPRRATSGTKLKRSIASRRPAAL